MLLRIGFTVAPIACGGYYDVALRHFGLMLAALTLGRLAAKYDAPAALFGGRF